VRLRVFYPFLPETDTVSQACNSRVVAVYAFPYIDEGGPLECQSASIVGVAIGRGG